jgi:hypothetical protein
MKNTMKLFGIIAMAAVIVFLVAGCGDPGGGGGSGDGGGSGSGDNAIIIIKNTIASSITVETSNDGGSGYGITSGLETKTIAPGAEETWTLGLEKGFECHFNIDITNTDTSTLIYSWGAIGARHGVTYKYNFTDHPDPNQYYNHDDYGLVAQ